MARSPRRGRRIYHALDTRDGTATERSSLRRLGSVEVNGGETRCDAFRMPHRYPHRKITLKQTLDDALAEKASPAETVTFLHAIVMFVATPSEFRTLNASAFDSLG